MATKPKTNSSGSEEEVDERKRKRMLSNRESARRSRIKKQQRLDELVHQVAQRKNENSRILLQTTMVTEQYLRVESENNVLRAQVNELSERLESMNEVLRSWNNVNMMTMMDTPLEMADPLLEPWQLPCSVPPVIASASIYQ